ncbi:MAG TPA: ankyrin repeat domain-containing protein [Fimbriimonadaceae bacterium]|jgi:ankyrin repeat protein
MRITTFKSKGLIFWGALAAAACLSGCMLPFTTSGVRNPYLANNTATSIGTRSFTPIRLSSDGKGVICKVKFDLSDFSRDELSAINVDFTLRKGQSVTYSKSLHLTDFPEAGSYSKTALPGSVAHMETLISIPKSELADTDHYWIQLTAVEESYGEDLHNPGHWFSYLILHSPAEIEAKIKKDPSLATVTDPESKTSGILFGCTHNSVPLLNAFLSNGADLWAKDKGGTTTLHMAAQSISVMKELLSKGIPVDIQDNRGYTPLMAAAVGGTAIDIACLLKHGADVNHRAKDGQTALMQAITWNDGIAARHLVADGAHLEDFDNKHMTALQIAAGMNNVKLIDLLVKAGSKVDWVHPEDKLTALHIAAKAGAIASVNELLKLGANANALSINHHTALDLAVHYEHQKVTDVLQPLTRYPVNTDWDHDPRLKNASAEDYQRLTGG